MKPVIRAVLGSAIRYTQLTEFHPHGLIPSVLKVVCPLTLYFSVRGREVANFSQSYMSASMIFQSGTHARTHKDTHTFVQICRERRDKAGYKVEKNDLVEDGQLAP